MSWLQVQKGGQTYNLKVVGEGQGNSPLKVRRNGATYDVCLVEVDDPTASPVRVKTSAGIKAIQLQQPTQFSDDFDDNNMNPLYWQQLQAGTASCSESGQQLRVSTTSGQNWSQAGYVTTNSYNMANKKATVTVANQNGVTEMELLILPNKVTNSDPAGQPNWYRIIRNNSGTIIVQRNLNGNIANLTDALASIPTALSIAVQYGQISFYIGGMLIYTDAYQLATYDCYVYAVTSSNQTATGAFDNFSIVTIQQPPTQISDNFNDNNMNTSYWQQVQAGSASCSESLQQLQVSTTGGQGWVQAGYVTTNSYNMGNKTATVTVANQNGVTEMELLILPNKVTNSDPAGQPNWYRIIHTSSNMIEVQRYLNYNLANLNSIYASTPITLAIRVQNSQIKFYIGGTLICTDTYQLATYDCYVYVVTSSNATGTGAFDNFSIASIDPQQYTITASAGTGGSINPSGTTTVNQGANQPYTITPNTGFQISNVTVDGTSQGAITSYTFTNIQANHTIQATFQPLPTVRVITASAGTGGTISPSGTTLVNQGGSQTYTITPNEGYSIYTVLVNNQGQGPISTYTFTNVQASQTIRATFQQN
jgi:hypothetical protein